MHYYNFAAVRGIQAGRAYYVTMCALSLIPKIFLFDEDELPPEFRAQRQIERRRVPEMARYIVENPKDYAFSSLTASVEGEVEFEPVAPNRPDIGILKVPMGARFVINDGQHRRAAIEEALKEVTDLRDETISVVLYPDGGLARCQQLFADLNKHAVRPTPSLAILYDQRDDLSGLARYLAKSVPTFQGRTEYERSSISGTSRKLFTLSAIHHATGRLIGKRSRTVVERDERDLATRFWTEIGRNMPDWGRVASGEQSAAELRRDQIQTHGLTLQALAHVGRDLLARHPDAWHTRLDGLRTIDWRRENPVWEGRALVAGRLSKSTANAVLTANEIRRQLGLELSKSDLEVEKKHVHR